MRFLIFSWLLVAYCQITKLKRHMYVLCHFSLRESEEAHFEVSWLANVNVNQVLVQILQQHSLITHSSDRVKAEEGGGSASETYSVLWLHTCCSVHVWETITALLVSKQNTRYTNVLVSNCQYPLIALHVYAATKWFEHIYSMRPTKQTSSNGWLKG